MRIARRLIAIRAEGQQRREKAALELILADGSVLGHLGHIVTTNAAIDPTTGTFTLEADFPNSDGLVIAGQFARVRAKVEVRKAALLVPQRSLVELQGAFSLFVVDAGGKVEQRKVTVGPKINRLQIISSGLKPGERVVLEGVQKIRSGMTIKATPTEFEEIAAPSSTNTPKA